MRALTQRGNQTRQGQSLDSENSAKMSFASNHLTPSQFHLGHTIDHQAVQRIPQAQEQGAQTAFSDTTTSHFDHNFSRIPLHASLFAGGGGGHTATAAGETNNK